MKNRIGIVGGGQLGRMLAFDAKKLGFTVTIIDPTPHSPAGQVSDYQIVAPYNDEQAIRQLADMSDFLTFEIELANANILDELSKKGLEIHPSAKTLEIIKDKLEQKKFLKKHHLPLADFAPIKNKTDLLKIAQTFGYPLVLKACFDGYDGRGNAVIKNKKQIDMALEKLKDRKLYVEKFVPFEKELAIMIARNTQGEIRTYPVVQTIHKNNICHLVLAPAPIEKKIIKRAEKIAIQTMQHLKGAGVFGIEMFLTKKGTIVINEIAPRVHNSGHYTIEACVTSQFGQHIRAISGLPLGEAAMVVPASVMINILGERNGKVDIIGLEKVLAIPNVSLHIYGKLDTKLERKMGHITVIGKTLDECLRKAKKARKLLTI